MGSRCPRAGSGAVVSGLDLAELTEETEVPWRWYWPAGSGEDGFQGCWLRGPRRPRADLLVGRAGFRGGSAVGIPELLLGCWLGPDKAGCGAVVVLGLVSPCWRVRSGPRATVLEPPISG